MESSCSLPCLREHVLPWRRLKWRRHGDWSFEITEPGLHTFNVWLREDGTAFDRLLITRDLELDLAEKKDEGPAESPRQ